MNTELCPVCHKYTVECDYIARFKRCLNASCYYQEYGHKKISTEGWLPTNPCDGCDVDAKCEREHYYDLENNCFCDEKYYYLHEIDAQRRLMEWLVSGDNFVTMTVPMRQEIASMIKETMIDELELVHE